MDLYGDFLVKLTQVLAKGPKSENDVAMLLGLEKAQAKVWLRRAAESGSVGKLKKPVRYGLPKQQYLL
jgi:predicted transcriptional regulator